MFETFRASLFMSFVLSHADYARPTPPRKSGFHRYQFMLFEQPPQARVTLTEQEKSVRGKCLHNTVGRCSVIYHAPTMIR